MPNVNLYFNNFAFSGEQRLIEDLIIESIKIYGMEVKYMPRTLIAEDNLFGEDVLSQFNEAYNIEMYIKNVNGFDGDGDFLSKFGLEIRDEMTLTVSQRRFNDEIIVLEDSPFGQEDSEVRPLEGDLIYFPLNGKIFEVKHVEHEAIFYQMGSLQTYDLRCELFEYSHEQFDTGISEIDGIEDKFSGDKEFFEMQLEDDTRLLFEDGSVVIQEGYRIENTDSQANNEFYQQSADFIDFSEINPFSEGGTW